MRFPSTDRPATSEGKHRQTFKTAARSLADRIPIGDRQPAPAFAEASRAACLPRRRAQSRAAPLSSPHLDSIALARAEAAYAFAWARVALEIEGLQRQKGLTEDARASALRTLRQRQEAEAEAARRRVLDEERANAKAARQRARQTQKPEPKA